MVWKKMPASKIEGNGFSIGWRKQLSDSSNLLIHPGCPVDVGELRQVYPECTPVGNIG